MYSQHSICPSITQQHLVHYTGSVCAGKKVSKGKPTTNRHNRWTQRLNGHNAEHTLSFSRCTQPRKATQIPNNAQARMRSISCMAAAPAFIRTAVLSSIKPKLLTLAIVQQPGRVLLGLKKRGFGQGYYNGFGGKVELGESIEQAAIRELEEEAGITATDMDRRGILTFVFDDQPQPWEVHVFSVDGFKGEPQETEEMAPTWFLHDQIPFVKMWADDVHWYPCFLQNQKFRGVFGFENTTNLVWHKLSLVADPTIGGDIVASLGNC